MSTHDLYGSTSDDLEAMRQAIEQVLAIKMIPHDSLYLGDYYMYKKASGEVLRLQRNNEPLDGEPLEVDFPQYQVLLYAENCERPDDLKRSIAGVIPKLTLLRRDEA